MCPLATTQRTNSSRLASVPAAFGDYGEMEALGYGAIVLAGGAGRRMGGRDKPSVLVAGSSMLDRVLAAVPDAEPRVVVGHRQRVPAGVVLVREDPPGGGPVAGIAAGLAAFGPAERGPDRLIAVLAADQPLLTRSAIGTLLTAAVGAEVAGAAFVAGGRPQLLCGVWRAGRLQHRLRELGDPSGVAVRALLGELPYAPVPPPAATPPPWYDCDTPEELAVAELWLRGEETS